MELGDLDYAVIDYLQPFIDGKVSYHCDLVRQGALFRSPSSSSTPSRHRGHTWCSSDYYPCACPCHWTEDEAAIKLMEILADESYEPEPVAERWLRRYMDRQVKESERLVSLAHERDVMHDRVEDALARVAVGGR